MEFRLLTFGKIIWRKRNWRNSVPATFGHLILKGSSLTLYQENIHHVSKFSNIQTTNSSSPMSSPFIKDFQDPTPPNPFYHQSPCTNATNCIRFNQEILNDLKSQLKCFNVLLLKCHISYVYWLYTICTSISILPKHFYHEMGFKIYITKNATWGTICDATFSWWNNIKNMYLHQRVREA